MYYQNIVIFLSIRNYIRKAVEILVERAKLLPPVSVLGKRGGMIVLRLSRKGVWQKMLTHQINAVEELTLGNSLQLPWRYVSSRATKGFAEYMLKVKL